MSDDGDTPKAGLLQRVLDDLIQRRSRGEFLTDEQVISDHPDLMPQLAQELSALRAVRQARIDSRGAGEGQGPMAPLTMSQLERTIGIDSHLADVPSPVPVIQGYSILREVSFGGQARVYQAVQESTGQRVAIKVVLGGPFVSTRTRQRFEREVEALASLAHPHIVPILDRGRTADGSLFLVMRFIEGQSLDEYLGEGGAGAELGLAGLLDLFIKICSAIESAHAQGIVHRDIKPTNLRIDRQGEPHVLDFGLARLGDADDGDGRLPVTTTGQIIGSLPWASPEQAAGEISLLDARTDVYSLGVVLYQALAGAFPYDVAGSIRSVQDHIAKTPPAPLRRYARERFRPLRRGLEAVALKALAKDPRQRYATAGALGEDLARFVGGRPTLASRPAALRQRLATLAAALILFAAGGGYWLYTQMPGPERPEYVNSIGMRLVLVPPGQFDMGSPATEPERSSEEVLHHVTLTRGFYLGVIEVTQGQFKQVMGRNPTPIQWADDECAVRGIARAEAEEFCQRLSQREGRRYRLPTEAEWEYACRAGDPSPFGGRLDDVAWYARTTPPGGFYRPATKRPNAWGIYDMLGGVMEWCSDAADDGTGYSPEPQVDPQGPPQTSPFGIARGGASDHPQRDCRAASRAHLNISIPAPTVGFRVILEP